MPNTNRIISPYIPNGDPDTMNETSLYAPGDLGAAFDCNDRAYQVVQLDSGATASTAVGVVAANQVAFWKDQDKYLVTNNNLQAIGLAAGAPNFVAGIFRCAATAGNYICILQRGDNIPVADDGGDNVVGDTAVADATVSTSRMTHVNVGTASTFKKIGIVRGVTAAAVTRVDVDIPNIP